MQIYLFISSLFVNYTKNYSCVSMVSGHPAINDMTTLSIMADMLTFRTCHLRLCVCVCVFETKIYRK